MTSHKHFAWQGVLRTNIARAAGATYKINEGTGGTVLINLEIFDNYMEQFRQPARPLKEPLYGQEEGEVNE